jgi:hypothetical protein
MLGDKSDLFPTYQLFERSSVESMEHFALAPLKWLAPVLEREPEYSVEEVTEWYEKAVDIAMALASNHTNEDCLDKPRERKCENSVICPRKEVRSLLVSPAQNYDFGGVDYAYDPARYVELVEVKMQLAVEHGLITDDQSASLLSMRNREQSQYLIWPNETD